MTNVAKLYNTEKQNQIFGSARILKVNNEKRTAQIYLDGLYGIQEIQAALALPFEIELSQGDKVLVIGEDLNTIYIIGVLSVKSPPTIRSKDGTYAQLTDTNNKTSLQIFSKHNELIIEHDTEKNTTKVNSGSGNLEFTVPEGNIAFQSGKTLTFGANTISFKGKNKIDLSVQELQSNSTSSFSLERYQAKLNSPALKLTAKSGTMFFNELKVTGKKVFGNLAQLTLKTSKLETSARSIISKTKNMYQTIENLSQLKTGRLKTLVKSTYHIKSKKTVMKSEEDFKIKAERIDLG